MTTLLPSALLRQQITIADYTGPAGDGPAYAAPRTVRARVEGRRRVVRTAGGADLISSATAWVRPGDQGPPESRVTWEGRVYEAVDVIAGQGLTRPSYYELILS